MTNYPIHNSHLRTFNIYKTTNNVDKVKKKKCKTGFLKQ